MAPKRTGGRASKFADRIRGGSPRTRGQEDVNAGAETETPAAAPASGVSAVAKDAGESPADGATSDSVATRPVAETSTSGKRTRGGKAGSRRRVRPEKPVRITVDLDAERHRFLRDYAYRQDAKGTAVVRALLDELRDDPGLSERVSGRLSGTA